MSERMRSEQQEAVDGALPERPEPTSDEPAGQLTTPDGGEPGDDEPDEIAESAGGFGGAAPEDQAMHVEDDEEGGGRTGSATSGYLDSPLD